MTAPLNRGLVLLLALLSVGVVLSSITPALAASLGLTASCSFVNPNRMQCNIPILGGQTADIQYVSMQCGSTGTAFSLQEVQVLVTPPGSNVEVAYQIPITNRSSLGGVVTTGASVNLYVAGNTASRVLIDLTPAPTGRTQCTVSLSGVT